jgi:hypothetical protein
MPIDESQIGPLFRARKFDALREACRTEPTLVNRTAMRLLFDSAARSADLEAMQFVLDIGFDINDISYTGTPLSRAASNGSVAAIQWLVDHGAQIDESAVASNPLFSAIQGGNVAAVRMLLERGASLVRRYPCGRDALDFARTWNNPEIIAALGADLEWKRPPWVRCTIPDLTGQKPSVKMLAQVESELGTSIPESLRRFLLEAFPEHLFYPDARDSDEWVWLGLDHMFFHTARSLIAYNCVDPEQERKALKYTDYFVIGTDGSGNDWCLHARSKEDQVWSHDHETEEFSLEYKSLKAFSEALRHKTSGAT